MTQMWKASKMMFQTYLKLEGCLKYPSGYSKTDFLFDPVL